MEHHPTPLTDAWRERLRRALREHGRRADLARALASGPDKVRTKQVQIARVLNQGVIPDAEFVLAVERWLARPIPSLRKDKSSTK